MAMGLSSTDYEVVDLRPQGFGDWITTSDDADALILDLENPKLAIAAVSNLRAHAKLAPVLLVSSDRPGWDDQELRDLEAAEVLPLPISRPALLSALEALLAGAWARREAVPPQHAEVAEALQELVLDPEDLLSEDDPLDTLISAPPRVEPYAEPYVDASEPDPRRDVVPSASLVESPVEDPAPPQWMEAVDPVPEGPAPVAPVLVAPVPVAPPPEEAATEAEAPPASPEPVDAPPLSAVPRTRRSARLPAGSTSASLRELESLRPPPTNAGTTAPRRREALAPAPEPVRAETVAPARQESGDPASLVRRLRELVPTLFGVPETADVVVSDAVLRTRADAGALLIPDDGAWRVSAGVGLRPLEHRYELHGESWLVQQVAQAHKGVIIEESDIAREQLQGAPLASWRNLLAVPVPQVEALLLLARRDWPPFDEDDLTVLARLGDEAGPLLATAMETRALARALWEFRDELDLPR